ncbi:Calcyphosin-like protein [Symbiodinium microadriaticum]|uniref:Calcyphosin-like protein n=1 Tax=Symbiodinium microadriaticum TaxID=2951 RepID=A0A1Q9E933_SYMMI|nr:Calcyphosin-like protein [Symbiodinium microadriaticum]
MSLQELLREQQSIAAEQRSMRTEFNQLRRKIDDYIKSEMQRLSSRLDANEARIARLAGAPDSQGMDEATKSLDGAARSLFETAVVKPTASRAARTERTANSNSGPASRPPPQLPIQGQKASFMQAASDRQAKENTAWKAKLDTMASTEEKLKHACQHAPSSDVWEEPGETKVSNTVLDHAEEALRRCFEKTKEFQRYENNPLLALNNLFNRLDRNHSGKLDRGEFANLCSVLDFHANNDLMSALFRRYDLDRSNYIKMDEFGRMLFKVSGDKEGKALSTIAKLRAALALRAGGFETLKAMGSQFRIMDHNHSNELSKEEFSTALDVLLGCFNLHFSAAEKLNLFQQFDRDSSGSVDYDEFVRGIRGDMNEFRLEWVDKAFSILDKDGSGVVETSEMSKTYDVSQNPAVKSGKVTPQQAITQFMQHFDANSDGRITREEFLENYQWVSASIDSDDYFELMMRNAWHIAGGEGWCANTSNLRVLVKHTRSPDEVVCVLNDLGMPREPQQRTPWVIARLREQGVKDIAKIEFCG